MNLNWTMELIYFTPSREIMRICYPLLPLKVMFDTVYKFKCSNRIPFDVHTWYVMGLFFKFQGNISVSTFSIGMDCCCRAASGRKYPWQNNSLIFVSWWLYWVKQSTLFHQINFLLCFCCFYSIFIFTVETACCETPHLFLEPFFLFSLP